MRKYDIYVVLNKKDCMGYISQKIICLKGVLQ